MARPEGRFIAAEDAVVDEQEILAALKATVGLSGAERQAAIARVLVASEGWRDALLLLGGSFALDAPETDGDAGKECLNQRTSECLQAKPLKQGGKGND